MQVVQRKSSLQRLWDKSIRQDARQGPADNWGWYSVFFQLSASMSADEINSKVCHFGSDVESLLCLLPPYCGFTQRPAQEHYLTGYMSHKLKPINTEWS